MSDIADRGTNFVRDLGEAARQNPISAALIGMGALWMLSGRTTPADMVRRSGLDRFPEAAGEAFNSAGETLKSSVSSIGSTVSSATEKAQKSAADVLGSAGRLGREQAEMVSDYARNLPETGAEWMGSARSNLSELFRTQPLALGAVGFAIGAGIAAALPPTEVETEYLGETSDAVKERAQELVTEQAGRAADAAERALTAAAEEARKQGLTLEGAKSAATEMAGKVERVVDAAGKKVSEGAK